jgi:transcriptional regulator with XRE-family HTH domain
MSPELLRAARALLNWTREDLATRSGTSAETVRYYESRGGDPRFSTIQAWVRAFQKAGVEFIAASDGWGEGLRFRSPRKP